VRNTTITKSEEPRTRTAIAITMLAGPALLLAAFAIHPSDTGSSAKVLKTISDHQAEWVAAHVLLFAAAVLLIPAVLSVARLVIGSERRVATIAASLLVFAAVGLGGAAAFEQLIGVAAQLTGDAPAMGRLLDAAQGSTAVMGTMLLPQLAVALGFPAMALALGRSKTVPAWAATIMAIGGPGLLAPEPGRCIAAALLLAAFIVALRSSRRTEPAYTPAASPAPATAVAAS